MKQPKCLKMLCIKCKINQNIFDFSLDKNRPSGRYPYCKICQRKDSAVYYAAPEGRAKTLVREAKKRAKRKNLEYKIDFDWVLNLILKGKCQLTGLFFDLKNPDNTYLNPYSPSIDRIDSDKGYTKENTRVVLTSVNGTLNQYGETTMLPILKAMVKAIEKNAKQNTTSSVPTGHYSKSEEHTKHGVVSCPGTWENDYSPNHHRGAVYGQDTGDSSKESSGDGVAHRNKKVEPSSAFTRSEDNGDTESTGTSTEVGGGRLFD